MIFRSCRNYNHISITWAGLDFHAGPNQWRYLIFLRPSAGTWSHRGWVVPRDFSNQARPLSHCIKSRQCSTVVILPYIQSYCKSITTTCTYYCYIFLILRRDISNMGEEALVQLAYLIENLYYVARTKNWPLYKQNVGAWTPRPHWDRPRTDPRSLECRGVNIFSRQKSILGFKLKVHLLK